MKKIFFSMIFIFLYNSLQAQQNPHGIELKYSCITCHTNTNWYDISKNNFDHSQAEFVLHGAHKKVNCISCHSSLKFSEANTNCFDCHTDIHKGELGKVCNDCHSENRWDERSDFVKFHNQTDFPLTGVHASLDCESCHVKEQQRQYANTPVECSSCHLDLFMTTLDPNHQKAGFDLNCQNCHLTNSSGWKRSIFNHSDIFPLSGGHGGLSCEECHGTDYNIKKVVCVDCHKTDFEATVNPDHNAFMFSLDCEECHTGISWQKTVFNHFAASGLALDGRHDDAQCIDCHENNQLTGWPVECSGCHLAQYNAANDPNHIAANFPLTCEDCHSAKGWEPAIWDHDDDYFPINSGKHKNKWDDCSDCHIYPANYNQFECIYCHEHRQSEMDDEHRGKRDYIYESQACYDCHPRGRE